VLENNVAGIAYQRNLHGAEGAKTSENRAAEARYLDHL